MIRVSTAARTNLARPWAGRFSLEATLSDPSLLDEVQHISRTFPLGAVRALGHATPARMAMLLPVSTNISRAPGSSAPVVSPVIGGPSTGFNSRVNNNANTNSETEVAGSADGQHIVIVNKTRDYITSNDFGTTFTQRFNNAGAGVDQGDPSVSFRASGAFYRAHIRQPNGTAAAGNVTVSPRLVCSTGGGANWGTSVVVGTGDFPRITVGEDGYLGNAKVGSLNFN